jgi:O-acetyl-ADP-ribose deacetylase (regulator of RNase III)
MTTLRAIQGDITQLNVDAIVNAANLFVLHPRCAK